MTDTHECVFEEEQTPTGSLVLHSCSVCGFTAKGAMDQLRRELAAAQWKPCPASAIKDGQPIVHCSMADGHDGMHYARVSQYPYPDAEYMWQLVDRQG